MRFTDPDVRPTPSPPAVENIPIELQRLEQWVLWRFDWNPHSKQWAKVPYNAQTLRKAKSDDPSTWASFDKAQTVYVEGKNAFDGIGFVFSAADEFCGIDFDECLDAPGKIIDPFVNEWVDRLDSYTEKSVSGTGIHVIVKGVSGSGLKRGKVEVYDRGRYFTFSGIVGKRREIHRRQLQIEELKRVLTPEPKPRVDPVPLDLPTHELLEKAFKAKNGASIRELYGGGIGGYKSPSEADQALCSKLAFWSGGDAVRLDAMFRGSRLFREKWDEQHKGNGQTYGQMTIETALTGCTEFYSNGHKPPPVLASNATPEKPPASRVFKLTTLDDLLAEPEEATPYAWDRTLPCGGVSILAAKPKVGKSTFARALAAAISHGNTFFGRATRKGKVIYLCLEEKRAEVKGHFRRMGASGSDILIHTGKTPVDALTPLGDLIAELSPVLVIIDPLSRFLRVADFNSYAEVTRQLEPLIDLARLSKCQTHLLCLHHNGKGGDLREGGDAVLGSTALFGVADALLTMRRREKIRTLESTQRYGEDLPETIVHLDLVTGVVDDAGDMQTYSLNERKKKVLEHVGGDPLTEGAIKELVGGTNGGLTSKSVRSLFEEGALQRTGRGRKGDPFLYRLPVREAEVTETLYFPPGASDEEIDAIAAQERYA